MHGNILSDTLAALLAAPICLIVIQRLLQSKQARRWQERNPNSNDNAAPTDDERWNLARL